MMIDLFIWSVIIFIAWNLMAMFLVFLKSWVASHKKDILDHKWGENDE
jgi:hypothetical protein